MKNGEGAGMGRKHIKTLKVVLWMQFALGLLGCLLAFAASHGAALSSARVSAYGRLLHETSRDKDASRVLGMTHSGFVDFAASRVHQHGQTSGAFLVGSLLLTGSALVGLAAIRETAARTDSREL
jgi:hypothetical protein